MLNRRTLLTTAGATVALATPLAGMAQGRKDAIVIGMALEPPGLDPTAGAAAEVVGSSPGGSSVMPMTALSLRDWAAASVAAHSSSVAVVLRAGCIGRW